MQHFRLDHEERKLLAQSVAFLIALSAASYGGLYLAIVGI